MCKVVCNITRGPITIILLSEPSNVSNSKSNNRCVASRVKQRVVLQTNLLCKYWKMSSRANIIISQFFLQSSKGITVKVTIYFIKNNLFRNKKQYMPQNHASVLYLNKQDCFFCIYLQMQAVFLTHIHLGGEILPAFT